MNIVDSLIVTLGLDASGFKKANKEVQDGIKKTGDEAEKLRKKHEAEAKKSAEAFKTVSDSVMGITAAIVSAVAGGAFLAFLKNNDAAAMNLARNINSTTQEVSSLEGVFRRMGSNTASAEGFLRTINKIQQELRLTGTSSALQPFVMAGMDVGAFRKAGPQQSMDLLADSAAKMDPARAQFYLQQAGMSEDQINLILRGRQAIDEMFASQQKLNVATKESGLLDQERKAAWADLDEAFAGTGREIANFVTPALVGVLHALRDFIVWIRGNVPGAVVILGTLTSGLLLLKGYSITTMASAFAGNIGIMGTAIGGLVGKLGLLAAAFTGGFAIGTAISELFGLDDKLSGDRGMPFDLQAGTVSGRRGTMLSPRSGGGSGTLGARNNNPGNLRFANQTGATQGQGGFAAFGSVTEGLAALENQLTLDGNRGMTLGQMIAKYAPASDGNNVGAYIADVSKRTGLGANSRINTSDPKLMQSLIAAMSAHEGNPVDLGSISAGMNLASSRGKGVGAPAINVGDVTIHTSANTLTGAGHDFAKGIHSAIMSAQSNVGVQ